jgi:hypothetical protein
MRSEEACLNSTAVLISEHQRFISEVLGSFHSFTSNPVNSVCAVDFRAARSSLSMDLTFIIIVLTLLTWVVATDGTSPPTRD